MKFIFILVIIIIHYANANGLANESSPYLKQHASNPVNWLPWGEMAFKKAKDEKKPIFLSIGYSTCHWCHVMEKESFEDKEMAKLFNKYFVCIKVDKEEMPQLDSYYQNLYFKVKNHVGGWPLSIFMTYDKKTFYMGTYIPKTKKSYHEGLDTLLPKLASEKQRTVEFKNDNFTKRDDINISLGSLSSSIQKEYDSIYSGFGRGKKFPEASKLSLMIDLSILSDNRELRQNSFDMLDSMALLGLYDHVDGGFFRYTTYAAWEIPHFEKMLYNQAQLIPIYIRGYLLSGKKLYKDVVTETINMSEKHFAKDYLYYSASDADSNGREGGYFTFSPKEVKGIKDFAQMDINFKGQIHLNFYDKKRPKDFVKLRKKLQKIREKKEYPFIDKKINTAWNAMMIEALFEASVIDKKYLFLAQKHLDALVDFMFDRGELYHQSLIGLKPKQKGLLEDYSFLISALISGYEVDYDEKKLDFAEYLLVKAKSKFYKNGIWYLSDDGLGIRADMQDKYYTSPLAKMVQNILTIASLKASRKYEKLAVDTLAYMEGDIERYQSALPASARAYLMQKFGIVTLKNRQKQLQKDYLKIKKIEYPFVVTKVIDNDTYVACTMKSCFAVDKKFVNIKKSIEKSKNIL